MNVARVVGRAYCNASPGHEWSDRGRDDANMRCLRKTDVGACSDAWGGQVDVHGPCNTIVELLVCFQTCCSLSMFGFVRRAPIICRLRPSSSRHTSVASREYSIASYASQLLRYVEVRGRGRHGRLWRLSQAHLRAVVHPQDCQIRQVRSRQGGRNYKHGVSTALSSGQQWTEEGVCVPRFAELPSAPYI